MLSQRKENHLNAKTFSWKRKEGREIKKERERERVREKGRKVPDASGSCL
jgi:hypothetical protein